ncbi:phosphotransferase [Seminibacterium arietis]|uniref:Phosphotransferase n=1 Tax=Seminibacterium arietis TaxID=1173502 RepID=A0ABW3I6G8_9PAST
MKETSKLDLVDFKAHVQKLLIKNKNIRVLPFIYHSQKFWLKQPEKLSGVWRFLKPQPERSFANEIKVLRYLHEQDAPIPELVLYEQNFLVLRDAGITVSAKIEDDDPFNPQKEQILHDAAKALADLHRQGLVHGRPALRDMTWLAGKVCFIDFESQSKRQDLLWKKVRDSLIFIHSLGREECISNELMRRVITQYKQYSDPLIWQNMLRILQRYRWIYFGLRCFRFIAKKDLVAIYRLFENTFIVENAENKG